VNEQSVKTWTFPDMHPDGPGPWADEPDKMQWVDEATDLDCLIVRNHSGALCGYVGLPPGHPLHGKDYDDAHDLADIDVHGGLTFADACKEGTDGRGICHVPAPGRPADVWWLGFDCAHLGDLVPRYAELWSGGGPEDVYRDIAYVQAECATLAGQLAAVAP
jgi:hypothetical protein